MEAAAPESQQVKQEKQKPRRSTRFAEDKEQKQQPDLTREQQAAGITARWQSEDKEDSFHSPGADEVVLAAELAALGFLNTNLR